MCLKRVTTFPIGEWTRSTTWNRQMVHTHCPVPEHAEPSTTCVTPSLLQNPRSPTEETISADTSHYQSSEEEGQLSGWRRKII